MLRYNSHVCDRISSLAPLRSEIDEAVRICCESLENKGKLLVAGNGGSAADAEHIVGELMKGFLCRRPLAAVERSNLVSADSEKGEYLAKFLQNGLPAVSLAGHAALSSAVINDNGGDLTFAQQLWALGEKNDVFIGISTSGNSRNVCLAAVAAKARGLRVLGLTGEGGGELAEHSDLCICVPEKETFLVQELHLPVYHHLCASIEAFFFSE